MQYSDGSGCDHPCDRETQADDAGFWMPERSEIVTQFFTRYLFFALAVIYFSAMKSVPPVLFSSEHHLLIALGVYFVVNSWFFHWTLRGVSPLTIRGAMVADLLIVTLCAIHDPNPIPPAALAFLMVLLGNGMRYGMRIFGEVLAGAFVGMAIAFAVRYRLGGFEASAGDVFFGIFWITLALYAYILMGRIEGQRRQLDYRSRFDAQTGLLNRHGLLTAADRTFSQTHHKAAATVLLADLDQFKAVNDRYGHSVGDRVLAEFGQILRESAAAGVCGRWDGDEFVAILPQRDDAAVRRILQCIEARIEAWSADNNVPMGVSLGVSHAPRDGRDLPTLLSVADIHLYRSKSLQPDTADVAQNYRTLTNEPQAS